MGRQFLTPVRLPPLSTTDRDALTAVDGDTIYNSSLKRGEIRSDGLWVPTSGLLGGSIGLWQFSTSTVDSDPGPGVLRLNNATQPSAGEIRFDPVDLTGADLTTAMTYLYGGSGNDIFLMRSVADPTKYLQGAITGYDTPTGYFKYFIIVLSHSGTFTNGEVVTLTGSRAGAAGADGADGVTGFGLAGDGSDGVVNFDGTTTRLGLVPTSNVYSLTRDIYLADGSQLSGSAVINTRNWRVFCSGTLTIGASARITGDGSAGGNTGTAAGAVAAGFYASQGAGGAGHLTGAGAGAGVAAAAVTGSVGGAGGAGGIASGSGTGGGTAGGAATAPPGTDGTLPRNYAAAMAGYYGGSGNFLRGGAGGSGGSNAASSSGGGGGGGGTIVMVCARVLVNNGSITARGGAGGTGSGTGTGGGGGGGGGGGAIIVVCGSTSTVGTLTVTGGAGGARQGAGANGAAGSAGQTFTLNV